MVLARAQRDSGADCVVGAGEGLAELWDESDADEEVDWVGDTARGDMVSSDSSARSLWLSSVLRAVSMSRG